MHLYEAVQNLYRMTQCGNLSNSIQKNSQVRLFADAMIYQLGDYILPTTKKREPGNSIDKKKRAYRETKCWL